MLLLPLYTSWTLFSILSSMAFLAASLAALATLLSTNLVINVKFAKTGLSIELIG